MRDGYSARRRGGGGSGVGCVGAGRCEAFPERNTSRPL